MELFILLVIIIISFFIWSRVRSKTKISRKYEDLYVLITGCDSGFGYYTALRLDALGFNVIAGCFSGLGEKKLKHVGTHKLKTMCIDVTDSASILRAKEHVYKILPPNRGLWGIVNNAGIYGSISPTSWLGKEDYEEVLNVNFYGMIEMNKHFLPLITKERGRIVNMSSIVGRFGVGSAPFCVASSCIRAYNDRLRQDLLRTGVTVHLVEPGFYKTNLFSFDDLHEQHQDRFESLSQEDKTIYGKEYSDSYGKRSLKMIETIAANDIIPVINAYEHALTGKFPHTKYVVGKDAKRVILPLSWIPEYLSDKFVTAGEPKPSIVAKNVKDKTS